ncbi:alpha/beta fold hydrolase [Evansella halocellulosilytica]|uniref:alpha/beta fold hydrolase n=1 Tax=Evansella halocellulosilytica TaxID=2011013 RepID=UPI0015C8FBC9|nr:alpha/beta hydrolase [Evansella halocellulosilytica]
MNEFTNRSLLFIHGAGGKKEKWRLIKKELNDYDSTFIDLPGRGADANTKLLTIRDYADSLNHSFKGERILVGHSMGGLIALEAASKNRNVKGVVLISSHYRLPVHEKVLEKLANGVFPDGLFYSSFSKKVDDELLAEERADIELVNIEQTYFDYKACDEYKNGANALQQLDIPILFVYGDEDRLIPERASEQFIAVNNTTVVKTIKQSGHYIMLEQPEALGKIINEFYEQFF